MEFKGTKGKWEVNERTIFTTDKKIKGNIICIIPEQVSQESRENWEYNKQLISKSPDMIKLLNEILECLDYEEMDKDNQSYYKLKITKLIKEATEL